MATAAAVLVFGAFVGVVHLGYVLQVDGIGAFASRHTIAELEALQRDRDARWLATPPLNIARLSREDQYLDEGLWHVRERNRLWDEQQFTAAWHENLILERFFTPVLDRQTYVVVERHPMAGRASCRRADGARLRIRHFVSQAATVSDPRLAEVALLVGRRAGGAAVRDASCVFFAGAVAGASRGRVSRAR